MRNETPFALGYRMPAEWEKHEATWLAWPKNPDTFPRAIIERVESIFLKMIEALAQGEEVHILVDDQVTEERISAILIDKKNISFEQIKTADVWIRDYGPIFVKGKDKAIAVTKWAFNAWGNKYAELKADDEAGMGIARLTGLSIFEPNIVLEGGSIDNNGCGSCITTEGCLLNENRNPHLNKKHIENYLKDYLGFTDVIWLKEGIAGDDTDGHVDDIARFVREDTVVCMIEENKNDENYKTLKDNFELLKGARGQDGFRLNVIPIPMPGRIAHPERRLPASYANFYIGNSCVLIPTFNDKNDGEAISIIGEFFPDREIVGINCEPLIFGFGGLHCVTQQQPTSSEGASRNIPR